MLLSTDITETNFNGNLQDFSIRQSPIAFEILSSRLYSDPILAIIRELLCNAYDAQVEAGTADIPIKLQLPSYLDSNFIIRDFGTGLSAENIETLYTTFFWSTKSDSNELTGGFGLGSKTPFAYADIFTVTSFYNGKKYVYACLKKDSRPSITKVSEEDTNKPNGLMITIPVREEDHKLFKEAFEKYIKYMPEIKVSIPRPNITKIRSLDNVDFYDHDVDKDRYYRGYRHRNTYIYIKQGQNVYSIDISTDRYQNRLGDFFKRNVNTFELVFNVPIGTLPITPNREQLDSSRDTIEKIIAIIKEFEVKLDAEFENSIQSYANTDMQDLVSNFMQKKYVKEHLPISFNATTRTNCITMINGLRGRTYDDSFKEHTDSIFPNKKTLLVLTDDYLTHGGIRKFRTILDQHKKDASLDQYDTILLVSFGDACRFDEHRDYVKGYLNRVRKVWKAFKTIKSVTEFNYDVDTITFSKFIKKYPVAKGVVKKEARKIAIDENTSILATVTNFRQMWNDYALYDGFYRTTIRRIKGIYRDDTLLTVEVNSIEEAKGIKQLLSRNKTKFEEYVKETYDIDNVDDVTFATFKRKGLTKDSGITIFEPSKFLDYLKETIPMYLMLPYDVRESIGLLKLLNDPKRNFFSDKEKDFIINSKLYQYLQALNKVYSSKKYITLDAGTFDMMKNNYSMFIDDKAFIQSRFISLNYAYNPKLSRLSELVNILSPSRRSNMVKGKVREATTNLLNFVRSF